MVGKVMSQRCLLPSSYSRSLAPTSRARVQRPIVGKLCRLACFRLYPCLSAVLKLLKMAKGMRALLDTVMQALPQVNVDLEDRHLFGNTGQKARLCLKEADL